MLVGRSLPDRRCAKLVSARQSKPRPLDGLPVAVDDAHRKLSIGSDVDNEVLRPGLMEVFGGRKMPAP